MFVPLTVGGGIRSIDDFRTLLRCGADKVAVNSAAVKNPQLLKEAADIFGSQCVVLAIDGRRMDDGSYHVYINGGRIDTGIDVLWWAQVAERLGCGEILLTSMNADGTKEGYDLAMTEAVCQQVSIPVIASGGCGSLKDFVDVFNQTSADAALVASLFHFGQLTVNDVKDYLRQNHIAVRSV